MTTSLTDRRTGTNAFSLFAKVKGERVNPRDREILEYCARTFGLPETISAISVVWNQKRLKQGPVQRVTAAEIKGHLQTSVPSSAGAIVGRRVVVEFINESGAAERLGFDIVPHEQADQRCGFLSAETKLVKAIWGRQVGDRIPYEHDDLREVRILEISLSERTPAGDVVAERQAIIQNAINKVIYREALRHAMTAHVSWGDFDPDLVPPEWSQS